MQLQSELIPSTGPSRQEKWILKFAGSFIPEMKDWHVTFFTSYVQENRNKRAVHIIRVNSFRETHDIVPPITIACPLSVSKRKSRELVEKYAWLEKILEELAVKYVTVDKLAGEPVTRPINTYGEHVYSVCVDRMDRV
jgi:hypothetical protein